VRETGSFGSDPYSAPRAIEYIRFLWTSMVDLNLWPCDLLNVIIVICTWLIVIIFINFLTTLATLQQILSSIDLFFPTGLITRTLGPSNDFTLHSGWIFVHSVLD